MENVKRLLIKSLTTKVAPMVYIMTAVSVVIGFCFVTGLLVTGGESILFASKDAIIPAAWWGGVLLMATIVCLCGYWSKSWRMVNAGSLVAFVMWFFASVTLFLSGHIYVLITVGLFHLLFYGYVYLASSLGVLQRQSI